MIKPKYIDMRRPGDDHIFQEVSSGIYEKLAQPKTGDIVFDIGAHAGFWTGRAAGMVGEQGRIYSFEPEPSNYALLCENVQHIKQVEAYPLAFSNVQGRGVLHLSHSSAEHSLEPNVMKTSNVVIDIDTLDTFFSRLVDMINFIKIDVEGHELQVLQGGKKTIKKCRPIIVMEIGAPELQKVTKYLVDELKYDWIKDGYILWGFPTTEQALEVARKHAM